MIDRAELKKKADLAREIAKQKKQLLKNPQPQYVDMPEEMTGDAELDSKADLDAIDEGFRARAKDEAARFRLATDSEYWFCVCFQSREQKEEFLRKMDLIDIGDKYLDGQLVAGRLGVEISEQDVPYNTSSKIDPKLLKLVKE